MTLIKLNTNPSNRELRQFAGIWFPAFWALVGWIVWNTTDNLPLTLTLWVVAGVVSLVGFILPAFMRPIFVGWMIAAYPIGWTVSLALLTIIYFLVLTPIGLGVRLFGRDPMNRTFDRNASSYWLKHEPVPEVERNFRQY